MARSTDWRNHSDWQDQTICRSTVVANIRRFERAVFAHSHIASTETEHEYRAAKRRLLANISKRII